MTAMMLDTWELPNPAWVIDEGVLSHPDRPDAPHRDRAHRAELSIGGAGTIRLCGTRAVLRH